MAKITIEYCSSYDSYNGEKVTEGKVLAPVLISYAVFCLKKKIIPENLRTWKHYGITKAFRSSAARRTAARAVPDAQSTFHASRAVRTSSSSHPSRIPTKMRTATLSVSTSRIPM